MCIIYTPVSLSLCQRSPLIGQENVYTFIMQRSTWPVNFFSLETIPINFANVCVECSYSKNKNVVLQSVTIILYYYTFTL